MSASDGKEWLTYYKRFPYFSTDTVRDGCHPRVFEHEAATGKAIVLCHGLTDSPYFLMAIARHFHTQFGGRKRRRGLGKRVANRGGGHRKDACALVYTCDSSRHFRCGRTRAWSGSPLFTTTWPYPF